MDLSGHTCSIQYELVYIFNQNQIFLTTATNRKNMASSSPKSDCLWKINKILLQAHAICIPARQPPDEIYFPWEKRLIVIIFLHFSWIHTKKSHTTETRLESDSEADIEETLVIKTNSKWEKFPVLELKAWSDYIQIDSNRDFRGRIFDAFHNYAFSSFPAFR